MAELNRLQASVAAKNKALKDLDKWNCNDPALYSLFVNNIIEDALKA